MSLMSFSKLRIQAANLNNESSLPAISNIVNVQQKTKSELNDDDGLFIGYGFIDGSFPYLHQDMYDREVQYKDFDSIVLENNYLKATFLPSLGGRLWSLFDKVAQRELTFSNPVFQPGNLAVRNAWFSGGVEWNCGMVGHHPYTCSQMFVSTLTTDDGMPVLRMYEFERIRCAVYQMDFFLPDDSKMLLCRMRITNPTESTVPMYWWSNIAVPEIKNARVVVAADEAYSNKDNIIYKAKVPYNNEIDITYSVNSKVAVDYFWKVGPKSRKYVSHIDENGYGIIQTSTNLLKGRKLFVWGQGTGGDNWQDFLSKKDEGRYIEIQAGLAHTQYECIPMPPKTSWEWIEAYGAINTDKSKIHGEWVDARLEVEEKLGEIISEEKLEQILIDTRNTIALKQGNLINRGSGWGALENLRRIKFGEESLPNHLNFGSVGDEQQQWVNLLQRGYFEDVQAMEEVKSWMNQSEWVVLIEKAVKGADKYNWYAWLQLGVIYLSEKKYEVAIEAINTSLNLKVSPWALYSLSEIYTSKGKMDEAANLALRASRMKLSDASLAKVAMQKLIDAKLYHNAIELSEELIPDVAKLGRIKLLKAYAFLGIGDIKGTEDILNENGGLEVPDIRECEDSVTDLWFEIQENKARIEGRRYNRSEARPPKNLDFRMFIYDK